MVRSEAEVERVLTAARGRVGVGIMVETPEAVDRAASLARLGISRAFVGLLDLAVERGTPSVFTALADGTVDRLVDALAPTAYGFGGLTDPTRGHPLPARLLMGEIVRGGCAFAMMRNAFVADAALTSPEAVLAAIRLELARLSRRDADEVADDRSALLARIADIDAGLAERRCPDEPAARLGRAADVPDRRRPRRAARAARRRLPAGHRVRARRRPLSRPQRRRGARPLAAPAGPAAPPGGQHRTARRRAGRAAARPRRAGRGDGRRPAGLARGRAAPARPPSTPARPTWCVPAAAATTRTPARNAPPGPTGGSRGCSPVAGSRSTPGMFSAWHRTAVERVVALDDHAAPLVPAAALARLRIATLPLDRAHPPARPLGHRLAAPRAGRRARPGHPDPAAPGRPAPPTPYAAAHPPPRSSSSARSRSGGTMTRDDTPQRRSRSPTSPGATSPRMDPLRRPTRRTRSATSTRSWPRRGSSRATGSSTWAAVPGSTPSGWPRAASTSPAWTSRRASSSSCARRHPDVTAVEGDLLDPPTELHGSFDVVDRVLRAAPPQRHRRGVRGRRDDWPGPAAGWCSSSRTPTSPGSTCRSP